MGQVRVRPRGPGPRGGGLFDAGPRWEVWLPARPASNNARQPRVRPADVSSTVHLRLSCGRTAGEHLVPAATGRPVDRPLGRDAGHPLGVDAFRVEVLPLLPNRWMAVVAGPTGEFATTSRSPEQVPADVERAVRSVVGWVHSPLEFVDERGEPWTPAQAYAQALRLDLLRRAARRSGRSGSLGSDARRAPPWSGWQQGR